MNEIKACPFCGGKECMADDTAHNCWNVYCICGAAGPEGQSQEDAILRWNVAENQLDMLSADLAEAQEQARQAVMREASTHAELQLELEALRNKVGVLNKNLIETTDRAMIAEVQRNEARAVARRLYQEREDELKMVKLINDTFRNASDLEQLRKERDEARAAARKVFATNKYLLKTFACRPVPVDNDTHTGAGYVIRNDKEQL